MLKDLKFLKGKLKPDHILDFLLSLLFVIIYFESTKEWKYARLEDLSNFTAHTPFQYRILIPFLANISKKIFPGINYIFIYQIILLLVTLFLCRFTRIFIKQYFREQFFVNIGIIILFYILFWNFVALGIWLHPADIPAILFFIIGLISIQRNNFIKYFPIFVLACFNRESIILILFAYIITRKNLIEILSNLQIIIIYTVAWLAIKYLLYIIFKNNPTEIVDGNLFLLKFNENVEFLIGLFKFDKFYLLRFFAFGGIYLFIPVVFNKLDSLTKKLLLIIPIFFVIVLFVGKFQEMRVFAELVPIFIVPGIILSKRDLLKIEKDM